MFNLGDKVCFRQRIEFRRETLSDGRRVRVCRPVKLPVPMEGIVVGLRQKRVGSWRIGITTVHVYLVATDLRKNPTMVAEPRRG
jgi:hypothetical protein